MSSGLTSETGRAETPVSLQLPPGVVAGVLLDELVRPEICPVTDGCLSGLFLVGEVRLVELGSGAHLYRGVSGGVESVSGFVPGGVVEDLTLSASLVIVLVNSGGCGLIEGLKVD